MNKVLMIALLSGFCGWAFAHSSGEQAGLKFVFGASPEPAYTGEIIRLDWMVSAADAPEGAERERGPIENASMTLRLGEESFGPYEVSEGRRSPGVYSRRHVFVQPGEYEATLSFEKPGMEGSHSIELDVHILDHTAIVVE